MAIKSERVTTSIKIKPDIWKNAKIEAIKNDMEVSKLVEEALEDWISNKWVPNIKDHAENKSKTKSR